MASKGYPHLILAILLTILTSSAEAGLVSKTYEQAMRLVGKTVATTGILLLCNTMACKAPEPTAPATPAKTQEASISSPEFMQALHTDYHDQEVLFINDFGQLTEGHAYCNSNADWFWVNVAGDTEVPVYEHEMIGILAPEHEYVGTALVLPPLDGTGKNLLQNIHAIIDRVYIVKEHGIEEGAEGKRAIVRDVPTGYAITVISGTQREDGKLIAFHLPFSVLIAESDISHSPDK